MSEDRKKKGLFSKLLGTGKSCCCSVRIEEITEDGPEKTESSEGQSSSGDGQKPGNSSCCGG